VSKVLNWLWPPGRLRNTRACHRARIRAPRWRQQQ
jgi:hypothetical protein